MNRALGNHTRHVYINVPKRIPWYLSILDGFRNDPFRLVLRIETLEGLFSCLPKLIFHFALSDNRHRSDWNVLEGLLSRFNTPALLVPALHRFADYNIFASINRLDCRFIAFSSLELFHRFCATYDSFFSS